MPKNTRVYRCVRHLKHKYGHSSAIGICQKSTKQNYMTGKKIRKKTIKKRGGKRRRKMRRKRTRKLSRKYRRSINRRKTKGDRRKKSRVKKGGMEEGFINIHGNRFHFDPLEVDDDGVPTIYLMYRYSKEKQEACEDRGESREYCEDEEAWEPYKNDDGEHISVSRETYNTLINRYQTNNSNN